MKLLLACLLVACGSDSSPQKMDAPNAPMDGKTVDAKTFLDAAIDAPPDATTNIVTVTCPATPAVTIGTTASIPYSYTFNPQGGTIAQGDIVKFVMPAIHDVTPNTTGSDPGIHVPFGATMCKQFMTKGTFGFHCSLHGFMGAITVN